MAAEKIYDVVIIGGGPAGISCAVECQDSKLSFVLLERSNKLGGQLSDIPSPLRNFAGGVYENGESLRTKLAELMDRQECNFLLNQDIVSVNLKDKTVSAGKTEFFGRTIVLATGYRVAKLELPNENDFGCDVVYRTSDVLDHLKNEPVAVVGGGDSALLDALELAEFCPQVYLICRSDKLRARPDVVSDVLSHSKITLVKNARVVSLLGNGRLAGIEIATADKRQNQLTLKRLVVKIGYLPNTEPFVGQVLMDKTGHIHVDQNCATSQSGIFAIGDITNPNYPRIATAVGHGALAVAGIRRYLGQYF